MKLFKNNKKCPYRKKTTIGTLDCTYCMFNERFNNKDYIVCSYKKPLKIVNPDILIEEIALTINRTIGDTNNYKTIKTRVNEIFREQRIWK